MLKICLFTAFCFFVTSSKAGYTSSNLIVDFEQQELNFQLLGMEYLRSPLPSASFLKSDTLLMQQLAADDMLLKKNEPISESSNSDLKNSDHSLATSDTPVVLLLGGGPGFSSWNLEPIQQNIASWGYPVLLMDMAGIGANKHLLQEPPVTQWIKQIHALLGHVAKDQEVILVSHSWGALMAMLYLREHPENINKVILLNPVDPEKKAMEHLTAEIDLRNREETNAAWDDEDAWEQKTDVKDSEIDRITLRQIQQVLPTYFLDYKKGQEYAAQFTVDDFNIDLNIAAWKEYDANPIQYFEMNQTATDFYFLECKQDYLMPYNQQAIESQLRLKQSVVLDQCGHFPWIEQKTLFYKALKGFLDESI